MSLQNRSFDVFVSRMDNRTFFSLSLTPQNNLPGFNLNARFATAPNPASASAPVLSDASGIVEYMSLCGATMCLNAQPDKLGPAVLEVR